MDLLNRAIGGTDNAGANISKEKMREKVSEAVCRVLGCSVDPDAVLMAAGLDSLGCVELHAELEKLGKIDLSADRLLLSHPSVNALSSYLTSRTTANRVHGMTVLGWCLATISWLVGGTNGFRWRALIVLVLALATAIRTGSVSSAAIQAELASLFGSSPAMPSHHPLWKEAVPVLVIVTLCLWPTAFFVSSSLAFAVWGGPNNNRSSASSTFRTGQLRTGSLRGSPRGSPRRWSAGNGFFGGASNGAGGVGSVSGVGVGSARGQSPLAAVPVAAAKEAAPAEAPRTPPAASEGVQSSAAAPERSPSPPTSKAAASSSAGELGPSSAAAAEQLQLQQQRGRSAPSLSSPSGEAGNCGASGAAAAHERELALLRADLGDGVEVHQLERGRTVGLGSFGKVVLVRHAGTGTPFALKCLNRRLIVANGQQKAVQRERAIAGALSHPFCCRLIRTFKDAHAVYLLLEWCSGGELLRRLPEKGMPEAAARFYGGCTALALEHLHCKGIVYRDLKPENLLLDSRGYVKLCDFGFAKRLGASGVTHTVCGTPDFMAPEVIRSEGHGRPADLWSLGVLLYELVTGRPPFSPRGTAPQGVYAAVLAGVMAPAEGASGEFLELLRGLLQADAAKRFGWEQVKGSAWNAELDWSKLERRDVQPPVIPDLSHPCDTRYFAQYPENAVALNDSRENDDDEGGMGDGEGSGEFDDDRFGDGGGACAQEVELYGSWDNCF